ncbi:MAG: CpaD family pilus assembly protein [Hyphomicrobiales bacterium]
MRNQTILRARRVPALAATLAALFALAACDTPFPETQNDFVPVSSSDRFPIEVAKGPVKFDVPTDKTALNAQQRDTIVRFAQQAKSNYASTINVRRPSGGGRGPAVASAIHRILIKQGVPDSMIAQSTYPGDAQSPVIVSYIRTWAVTQECGNWDEDLTVTFSNSGYANFGCSVQNNVAAMVANPNDLVMPRTETPSDPTRRSKVFTDYRNAVPTNTQPPQQQQVQISTVAQQ